MKTLRTTSIVLMQSEQLGFAVFERFQFVAVKLVRLIYHKVEKHFFECVTSKVYNLCFWFRSAGQVAITDCLFTLGTSLMVFFAKVLYDTLWVVISK
jgi:hypothetical protein